MSFGDYMTNLGAMDIQMSENIITDYNQDKKDYNKLKELLKKRNKIQEKQAIDS